MTQGFHQNVQRSHETKDSDAIFMQMLNIFCNLAQYYYTNKMLFPTIQSTYPTSTLYLLGYALTVTTLYMNNHYTFCPLVDCTVNQVLADHVLASA